MISLKNVSFAYEGQDFTAIDNINLEIKKGECVLLCGRSGCGKTTVTRLINGMIPSFYDGDFQGDVRVKGQNILEWPMYQIAETVGSVFQNPRTQFYTTNTTSEIAFGCENMGMAPDEIELRVKQTAKDLDIEDLMDRNIFKLSGGEKQIIAFASVYATDPDIYVLDEPSSNLDLRAIGKVAEILRLLKAKGKTILVTEHRIYYLKDLVDRAIHFEEGRIGGEYSMEELCAFDHQRKMETGIRSVRFPKGEEKQVYSTRRTLNMRFLECSYDKIPILNIPKLRVSSNEIIAVVGENGAGKSTFVTCLCGLIKRQKGMYFHGGKPQFKKDRIKNSYMVLQEVNHQLFTDSVREEIELGVARPEEEALNHILETLNLKGLEERHPMTLSGGQKQRVAIGGAMFCKKQVLVFDEPTSGLDYTHMIQTGQLLEQLKEENRFIFVITHDYEFIVRCCHSVLHIEKNKQVEYFPLDEVGFSKVEGIMCG